MLDEHVGPMLVGERLALVLLALLDARNVCMYSRPTATRSSGVSSLSLVRELRREEVVEEEADKGE
jgi:hypothetical protein